MARRSAGNPRYRKDASVGATRRSAASAKPKRDVGEVSPKSGSSAKKKGGKGNWRTSVPDTPEYRRLRRVWFVLLVVAIVASLGGFFFRDQQLISSIALGLAYASLFSAFGIDLLKIRKMRKEWDESHGGGVSKKKASSGEGKAD